MPVNLIQYRASVGVFNNRDNSSKTKYLNYATVLPLIYIFNFPNLYDLIHFFKLLFQVVLQLCFFFMKHIDEPLFKKFQCLQNKLNDSIDTAKKQYYAWISMKLMDPTTSAKTYGSILKRFLNDKKIPCIPPLFHDNKLITDFKKKAKLFNSFFF